MNAGALEFAILAILIVVLIFAVPRTVGGRATPAGTKSRFYTEYTSAPAVRRYNAAEQPVKPWAGWTYVAPTPTPCAQGL